MISNLEEIKRQLIPEGVLELIGYEKRNPQIRGNEIRDFCPIHGGDHQRSLAICRETGGFLCHSNGCKGGDLISLYIQAKKIDFPTALEQLANYFGIPVVHEAEVFTSSERKQSKQQSRPTQGVLDEQDKLKKSREIASVAWSKAYDSDAPPYFKKKEIEPPPGVKYGEDEKGYFSIVVPFYDVEGGLQTIQYINEKKLFATGTTFIGAFFNFGSIAGHTVAYVCEGIATGASIWASENKTIPMLSCGSCGNIPKVIEIVKTKYPDLKIVVCLDVNEAADKAAQKVLNLKLPGISFRKPDFTGIPHKHDKDGKEIPRKDFNDLFLHAGLETVRRQLHIEHQTKQQKGAILEVKFIHEISPDYFKIKPPEKPVLLEYVKEKDPTARKIPFLHKEITAMLVAEGGRGKTHLCAMLAAGVVSGVPFLGKFEVKQTGAACMIVGENNQEDIRRLLWKVREKIFIMLEAKRKNDHEKFSIYQDALERIDHLLCPISVHGMETSIVDENGRETKFFASLLSQLKAKEPEEGWQLIILDPASRFAGTGAEKDNAIATAFIARLENISEELKGKPTILLAHHKNKAGQQSSAGQSDARGSSALTDGVRWQANLGKYKDDPNMTLFELTKTNFTPPIQPFVIQKHYNGVPEFCKWDEKNEKERN